MDQAFDKALEVLQRYISPVNARSLLLRALQQQSLGRENLTRDDLRKCAPNLRRGITLFVDAALRKSALQEIEDLCGKEVFGFDPCILQIAAEADIGRARAEARRICDASGTSALVMQKVATIVSELARNMVLYADGGLVEISPINSGVRRILVQATDHGPGIPNLQEIMSGRYKSKTGLGRGLIGTQRLADRFDISTGKHGTRVVAEVTV